ncbi:MAG: hypothetical protein U0R26_11425 [Solirubrobacterales bacterium]
MSSKTAPGVIISKPATRLRERLPAGILIDDPEVVAGYEQDIVGRFSGSALAVARPRNAPEVATVVAACAELGLPLVSQGGNTGLVGGAVPRESASRSSACKASTGSAR